MRNKKRPSKSSAVFLDFRHSEYRKLVHADLAVLGPDNAIRVVAALPRNRVDLASEQAVAA